MTTWQYRRLDCWLDASRDQYEMPSRTYTLSMVNMDGVAIGANGVGIGPSPQPDVSVIVTGVLNHQGAEGWELLSTTEAWMTNSYGTPRLALTATFKRPADEHADGGGSPGA